MVVLKVLFGWMACTIVVAIINAIINIYHIQKELADFRQRLKEIEYREYAVDEKEKKFEATIKIKEQLLDIKKDRIAKEISDLEYLKKDYEDLLNKLHSYGIDRRFIKYNFTEIKERVKYIKEYINAINDTFDKLSEFGRIKQLATLIADIERERDFLIEEYLIDKDRPAYKAAEAVSQVKKEKRELRQQLKTMQYEYELLCQQIPCVTEYAETPEEVIEEMANINNEEKSIEDWLSKEEWENLDDVARLQLALDRYNQRSKKSNRRVGYDYELYCGYNIEHKELLGCKVDSLIQYGIEEGLNDLGRDIIALCGDKTFIIQCKRWSKERPIRENTIMQLYGSVAEYCMNKYKEDKQPLKHLGKEVIPVLMTTTDLSDVAARFANYLGVQIRHTSFDAKKYPQIKCNIGKDGEKIYHLPFDQQYDTIKIEKEKGECFAFTIKEAEKLGFRHAMRWQGNTTL